MTGARAPAVIVDTRIERERPSNVSEEPISARFEVLERDGELATVEALITGISGAARLLAIEGPPGIGKTALIAETKAFAQGAGLRVLGARGSELERAFSYGVVRQLFEPVLASVPADERSELLGGAAALATPLFDPARLAAEPAADSSLATLHGLYWLTANLAARGPLLLAIDDLHWCDLPSLRWLAFLLPAWRASTSGWSSGCGPGSRERTPACWARSSQTRWRPSCNPRR